MSELPRGWVEDTLGAIGTKAQSGFPSGRHNADGRGVPHLRPMNIDRLGRIDLNEVKYVEGARERWLEPGDVLFNNTNSPALIGKTAYFERPGTYAFSNHMTRLQPPAGVDPKFLAHQLHTKWMRGDFQLLCSHHVNQASVSAARLLSEVPVVLPPLNEQRRIVGAIEEHLSRLDAAMSHLRHARPRVNAARSGVITSAVEGGSWPRIRWRDVGWAQNGRAFPSRDYSAEGVKLLRPGNLHVSGQVDWNTANTRHLPEDYAAAYPKFIIGENEIVMNLTAQSLKDEFLGRVCLTGTGERCLLNQRIARLSPNEADPRFVFYAFQTRRFRDFVASLNTGSLIQHMFTSQLDEYELPMPPLEQQRALVTGLEAQLSVVDALGKAIERAQLRSTSMRRAVLERAFRGELVRQDPRDEPASVLLERIRAEPAAAPTTSRRGRARA